MNIEDQGSVFDDIEQPKEKVVLKVVRTTFMGILVFVSVFFFGAGAYLFYETSQLPNVIEVYNGDLLNEDTIFFFVISLCGLITLVLGVLFLYLKKTRLSISILVIGNLITYLFSLYI